MLNRRVVASLSLATYLILALSGSVTSALAKARERWVAAGRTIDNTADIFLKASFSKKSGTFRSLPDSVLEAGGPISGDFLLGTYRFAYTPPIVEGGVTFDELSVVEVMDCPRSYFGTVSRTKRFKGRVVGTEVTPDAEILMMQTRGPTMDSKLCELHGSLSKLGG
jgi:hypothetical protein